MPTSTKHDFNAEHQWECLDQHVIDNAVKQWRKGLHACVAANGGHSEHLL